MSTVCPTDIRKYNDPNLQLEEPVQLGHEGAGVVEEVGSGVNSFEVGDRVAISPKIPCGSCRYCAGGLSSHCSNPLGIGCSIGSISDCARLQQEKGIGGTFSQYLKVSEENVVKIPANVDFVEASLSEPLADVINSIKSANLDQMITRRIMIFGGGPMGLLHVIAAKSLGVKEILLVEPIESRRELARKLGASATLDPKAAPLGEAISNIYPEDPRMDAIFVTVPGKAQESVLSESLHFLNKRGTLLVFASSRPPARIQLDLNWLHYNSARIAGVVGYTARDFLDSIDTIERCREDVRSLVRPIIPLQDIARGFEIYGSPESLKVGISTEGT